MNYGSSQSTWLHYLPVSPDQVNSGVGGGGVGGVDGDGGVDDVIPLPGGGDGGGGPGGA